MKRYTTAQARSRFAELLDAAEWGQPVVIERRGTRATLEAAVTTRARTTRRKKIIVAMDPLVASGQWTWRGSSGGLRPASRSRHR